MAWPNEPRPLRILVAAHGYPPQQSAGAEWRAHRLATGLHERGHEVGVLAIDKVDLAPGERWRLATDAGDGPVVHRLSLAADQAPGGEAEFRSPDVGAALERLAGRSRPDLVHVISGHRLSGSVLEAAAGLAIPSVVTLTDFWFACPRIILRRATGERCDIPDEPATCAVCILNGRRRYRWAHAASAGLAGRALSAAMARGYGGAARMALRDRMVDRRAYLMAQLGGAARVVAPSRFMARTFAAQGVPLDRLVVMRQGLAIEAWPAAESREQYVGDRPLRVGYIGQMAEHKGVPDLVDAFRRLPRVARRAELSLHGDLSKAPPDLAARLQHSAASDGGIVLAGPFANSEIRRVHARLDVLVVPSRWYENSPNVILESFACGTPVIAADLGGMAELIENGVNGLLFDPARPVEGIAAALARVIDEPALLTRLHEGLPAVKTLDEELGELEALYRQVLAERAVAA